jgi:hypothetical protein
MDRITLIGLCSAALTVAVLFMVWLLAADPAALTLSAH